MKAKEIQHKMTSQKNKQKYTKRPKHMIFIFIITFFSVMGFVFSSICSQNRIK
jgi:hypothetical protein